MAVAVTVSPRVPTGYWLFYSWITITNGLLDLGNGYLRFNVLEHTGTTSSRTGYITVSNGNGSSSSTVSVVQEKAPGLACNSSCPTYMCFYEKINGSWVRVPHNGTISAVQVQVKQEGLK
ncbi:MAG: BACON domain-containing carbohydrate-binding protein [Bacteroidia bacterium]